MSKLNKATSTSKGRYFLTHESENNLLFYCGVTALYRSVPPCNHMTDYNTEAFNRERKRVNVPFSFLCEVSTMTHPLSLILSRSLSLSPSIQRHVIASFFRTLALSGRWIRLIHQTNGGRSDWKIQALIMVLSSFYHHSPACHVCKHT